jgi:hypothetical protein
MPITSGRERSTGDWPYRACGGVCWFGTIQHHNVLEDRERFLASAQMAHHPASALLCADRRRLRFIAIPVAQAS